MDVYGCGWGDDVDGSDDGGDGGKCVETCGNETTIKNLKKLLQNV